MFFNKKNKNEIDLTRLPQHIGVIMDGNGRWARRRGLPRSAGHSAGADALKKIITEANNLGVKYITVYAFSTENWKRPKEEVDYLMSLLLDYLRNAEKTLAGENVVIRAIGSRKELSQEIRDQIIKTEEFTKNNTGIVMNIALNYGAREEITNAVREICEDVKNGKTDIDSITDKMVENHLYTKGQPDVDLLIRTSGEQRLSNFMLWQVSYAEMWFTNKLWPDFKPKHLRQAIYDFQNRGRRFGGV
ncbi:isoprenyl transferase [Lachnospiraceae bacterium MD329]|nr:isoprenyl transferase [Lachnospiraceae bacterium MD329]